MLTLSTVKITSELLDRLAAAAEKRSESVVFALESMIKDYIDDRGSDAIERVYKVYRIYPEYPNNYPHHLVDAPSRAEAENLIFDLVAASKPENPRHYRIVERTDRVVYESGASWSHYRRYINESHS